MSDIELEARDINGRLSLLSCFPSSERGRHMNFVNLHCVRAKFFMPGRVGLYMTSVHSHN